jgi:hypothetical protein
MTVLITFYSGTYLTTRHTMPRWPCSLMGDIIANYEQHTTAAVVRSHGHLYRHVPNIVGTHVVFVDHMFRVGNRACASFARLYA